MNKELEIINQIKALRNAASPLRAEREKIFLGSLKNKLVIYMSQNPARMGKFENFYYNIKGSDPFANLKNIGLLNNTYATSAALLIIVLAIGVGGIASASQASLPGDNLYPIKILSEEIRSRLAASPASQALLETDFAARRVEEIKQIVKKNGIESKKVDIALDHLQKNTAKAADIINSEKQKGNDVSALAKDIEEKNTANQNSLERILKNQEENINESSDEDKNNTDKAIKTKENNDKKEAKSNSGLKNNKKPETKKDKNAAVSNPEAVISPSPENNKITPTPSAKKRDNDSSSDENEEYND